MKLTIRLTKCSFSDSLLVFFACNIRGNEIDDIFASLLVRAIRIFVSVQWFVCFCRFKFIDSRPLVRCFFRLSAINTKYTNVFNPNWWIQQEHTPFTTRNVLSDIQKYVSQFNSFAYCISKLIKIIILLLIRWFREEFTFRRSRVTLVRCAEQWKWIVNSIICEVGNGGTVTNYFSTETLNPIFNSFRSCTPQKICSSFRT